MCNQTTAKSELLALVSPNEEILWQGRPDKTCFLFEAIFNPFLFLALLWGAVDFGFITAISTQEKINWIMIPFFALHLMPVWIYLFGVLFSYKRYRNSSFIITDHAVYISSGFIAQHYERKPFTEMSHVNLSRGLFDQWLGVGDVILTGNQAVNSVQYKGDINICDIRDYLDVYQLVKRLQTDIFADTMYPNDLRPPENHGYKTKYVAKK